MARLLLFGTLFLLLALALWNPPLPSSDKSADLLLLLDDSISMENRLSDFDWANIQQLISELPSGSRLSILRFAADSALEVAPTPLDQALLQRISTLAHAPQRLPLNRNGTNLAAALERALRLQSGATNPVVLIVSDGGETVGDSSALLRQAKQAQVNVFALLPRPHESITDIAINSVHLPSLARHNERIPVTINISATDNTPATLNIYLNKQLVATHDITLTATSETRWRYWLQLTQPGANQLEIEIEATADEIPQNNRYQTVINSNGSLPVAYVTTAPQPPGFAAAIKRSGNPIDVIPPARLQRRLTGGTTAGVVILDDISYYDINEDGWRELENTVRNQGTGLLVLGGPRSFAEGGYRHSRLESLLPLIAEARQPQESVAALFLVDKSGSMSRDADNTNRLAYARKAVMETAATLTPDDQVGLIAFDAAPQEILKLGRHRLRIPAIEDHWRFQSGGGTNLSPALKLGIERLAATKATKRLLIVVTDGFVGEQDIAELESMLSTHKIDLIALAVGSDVETETLQRLAAVNNGRFSHIHQQARLPRLMRQQVERTIKSAHLERSTTHQRSRVPFMPVDVRWPPVSAYMVTRPRTDAALFLQSDAGHPLFAAHNVGAARVAALPAGLGQWVDNWHNWPMWGEFSGGLLQWLSINYSTPETHVEIIEQPGRLELQLDAVDNQGAWRGTTATLQLTGPDRNTSQHTLTALGPGRYSATVPTPKTGLYHLNIVSGDTTIQRDYFRNGNHEFSAVIEGRQRLREWQKQGLINNWTATADAIAASTASRSIDSRPFFIIAAILLYLGLIFHNYKRP